MSEDEKNNDRLNLLLLKKQKKTASTNKNVTCLQKTEIVETLLSEDTFKSLPQNIISKNWLKTNVQNSWWNELDNWHQHEMINNRFKSANLFELWKSTKSIKKKNYTITGTLSEYQALRELVWMFFVQTSMVVFQEERENKFLIRNVSIPSLTAVRVLVY